MNVSWSPQQRQWLQALGHDVLMLAAAEAPPQAAETGAAGVRPVIAPTRQAAPTAGDSPLLRALLRAAGRRDLGGLAWLPDPATLRGDAAAKRALWPRLRTLRKPPSDA
ncbi:MAG: hypothetical protein ACYC42_03745 [Lysobacter sp.]